MKDHIWALEEERALEIIHEVLIQELSATSKKYLPLQELMSALNRKGKRYMIHKQKKHNCWSKYIKMNYGSFETFLGNFGLYEVVQDDDSVSISLPEQAEEAPAEEAPAEEAPAEEAAEEKAEEPAEEEEAKEEE